MSWYNEIFGQPQPQSQLDADLQAILVAFGDLNEARTAGADVDRTIGVSSV